MAKYFNGIEGKLSVNGVAIGRVREWSINTEVDTLATTTLADYAHTARLGRQSCSGSCTVLYYETDQGVLAAKPLIGTLIRTGQVPPTTTYRLKLECGSRSVELDAFVISVSTGAAVGDVMAATIGFVANGPIAQASLGGS
jgi:hypothetical protein